MKLTIFCPHCDINIELCVENDEIVYVKSNEIESASHQEIRKTLAAHNIEFG